MQRDCDMNSPDLKPTAIHQHQVCQGDFVRFAKPLTDLIENRELTEWKMERRFRQFCRS